MAFSYSPKIVTDGLVLYLDAGNSLSYPSSGTTWTDLSRSMLSGSLVNGPTYSSANGGSVVFDGANNYVNLGNNLTTGTNSFSIEFVAKASTMTTNYSKIITKGFYNDSGFAIDFGKNPAGVYFTAFEYMQVNGVWTAFESAAVLTTDTWYDITYTYNSGSSTMSQYINSTLITSSLATPNITSSWVYTIGSTRGGGLEFFKGNISIVKQYNRALSAQEVLQNYNATKGRFGL